jgi:hypothetical protein
MLGGTVKDLINDITQAALMWKLRVKIDVWSKGVDDTLRQRNRELLMGAYLWLLPCRVWPFPSTSGWPFKDRLPSLKTRANHTMGRNCVCMGLKTLLLKESASLLFTLRILTLQQLVLS